MVEDLICPKTASLITVSNVLLHRLLSINAEKKKKKKNKKKTTLVVTTATKRNFLLIPLKISRKEQ